MKGLYIYPRQLFTYTTIVKIQYAFSQFSNIIIYNFL